MTTASGRVYRELRCNPAYDMVHAPPLLKSIADLHFLASALRLQPNKSDVFFL